MSKHKAWSEKPQTVLPFCCYRVCTIRINVQYMPKTAFSDGNVIIYADEQTNSGVFTTVEYIRHRCI